ncbi:hypothetical protein [Streptomyces cupreus]|uniref:Uncharacterized protein n=1 Tax=Streptomyces cupreus TaxID=2759956 RepID=A0A7X1JBY3_9ACTN|nr:hypothetical protein [Streptomyces cupreus]MBC2907949.1 hypothetical protein [Streptomyces cupreus]
MGVFFTWLAGSQGRKHAERMVDQAQSAERRARLQKERRDAYFAAMRVVDLDIRRVRYKQQGKFRRLEQVEQYWTKSKRVEMSAEAEIALHAYGSDEARDFAEAWRVAAEGEDLAAMQELAENFRSQMRIELQEA